MRVMAMTPFFLNTKELAKLSQYQAVLHISAVLALVSAVLLTPTETDQLLWTQIN